MVPELYSMICQPCFNRILLGKPLNSTSKDIDHTIIFLFHNTKYSCIHLNLDMVMVIQWYNWVDWILTVCKPVWWPFFDPPMWNHLQMCPSYVTNRLKQRKLPTTNSIYKFSRLAILLHIKVYQWRLPHL